MLGYRRGRLPKRVEGLWCIHGKYFWLGLGRCKAGEAVVRAHHVQQGRHSAAFFEPKVQTLGGKNPTKSPYLD